MKTKDITIIGILIALSLILGMVKFNGSIALDSVPAFLALYVYKDYKAGIVAGVGHMFSAMSAGFPFSLPVHILLALVMFAMLIAASFIIKKSNIVFATIFIFVVNAIVAPLTVFAVAPFSMEVYTGLVAMLSVATAVNLAIALIIQKPVKGVLKND